METSCKKTMGSLFTGIGGFDLGFERAGWITAWQVEKHDLHRRLLQERFPHAAQFSDVRECGNHNLAKIDCITAGFPCQDISIAGRRGGGAPVGLAGERSGLFTEVIRILGELQPQWVVLENVPALLFVNDCRDLQTVISRLADSGYVGCWRVLNAQGFGVPQNRRRLFMVAGLGQMPPSEFLADASPVEAVPSAIGSERIVHAEMAWPAYTLLAINSASRISLGSEILVAHEDGWRSMVERERISRDHGIPKGLDPANLYQRFGAGNAVVPQIAEWIATLLLAA